MNEEIKKLMDEVKTSQEAFKKANDAAMAQKADKGHVDAEIKAKVEAANAAVTDALAKLAKRVDEVEANRRIEEAFGGLHKKDAIVERCKAFADTLAVAAQDDKVRMTAHSLVTPEMLAAYESGFNKIIRFGEKGARLTPQERAAMEVGSDKNGGYLLPPAISQRVVELQYETTPMRQIATVEQSSLDRFPLDLDLDEADAGWVGERESRTETDTPEFGEQEIVVHELYANPGITQKLLDMGRGVEERLARKIASKMSRLENTAFVSGDGVKRPRGFTTYTAGTPSASDWDVIQQVASGKSADFADTDPGDYIIDLVHSLKDAYQANARFLMKRLTLAEVRKLKDGDGNYLWQPDFTKSVNGLLLGAPVTIGEDMAAIAANSLSIAYGDFKAGYTIVDGVGIRTLVDPFTNKPKVHFYSTKRVGGDVSNFEAIKLMKFAASV